MSIIWPYSLRFVRLSRECPQQHSVASVDAAKAAFEPRGSMRGRSPPSEREPGLQLDATVAHRGAAAAEAPRARRRLAEERRRQVADGNRRVRVVEEVRDEAGEGQAARRALTAATAAP